MTTADSDPVGEKPTGSPHKKAGSPKSDPIDELLEALGQVETSVLERTDVSINAKDQKAAKNFDDLEKARLHQANGLRPWFFGLAAGLAVIAVLTSAAMILGVVFWKRSISDGLGIAFVSSLSVETLGILAIVGQYLFTHPPTNRGPATEDESTKS